MKTVKLLKKCKGLIAILAILSVITACTSEKEGNNETDKTAWENIKEKGTLKAATSGTLFPASYHDSDSNELTGYDVEVAKELADRLGLKIEFTEMAFDGMLSSINSGQVDFAINDITVTDERKEKFGFTDPYKHSVGAAIVRKSDLSGIDSLEDLKGKKAAGEATTTYMEVARTYGAEEVIYDNATNDQYLRDVSTGRTDIILNDYYTQTLAVSYYSDLDITVHPTIRYNPSSASIILKKENEDMRDAFNDALKKMKEDGTLTKLSKQFYNGADVSEEIELEESK
ncbi:transporter substrate-binding domain-containing protein [Pradoshia sp.]|uniref:transporter substrate-binding domain-containing protein n=1 Tax=Pradoshia sp. TaxID=2651281 RepID=UPI003F071071